MRGRWRFRVVGKDYSGSYLSEKGKPLEHQGTDAEALALAQELIRNRADSVFHVEAVSVGCPMEISDTPGRLLVFAVARKDGSGWNLKGNLTHDSWHGTLEEAVEYAAFLTHGSDREVRIVSAEGKVTHVVLIPGSGGNMAAS